MVRNSELFRKMMSLPRELSKAKFRNAEGGRPPFLPGFGEGGKPPVPPAFGAEGRPVCPPGFGEGGKPPVDPAFGAEGRPPFAPGRPGEHPHFPPHGIGRGHGPMGRGMSRERMLTIISEHPEGIRQKALAEAAGINASSASEVVSRLEDDGYLIRVIDENDKRATVLKLTEMGAVRAEELRSEREAFRDEIFDRLTEEEKQTLSDLLDKLLGKDAAE